MIGHPLLEEKRLLMNHLVENLSNVEIAEMTKDMFLELLENPKYYDAFRALHNLNGWSNDIVSQVIHGKWDRFIEDIKEIE